MALAAALAAAGRTVTIADLPELSAHVDAVGEHRGVTVASTWTGRRR
ncbi:MAG: hypothetical protein ACT4PO_03815 [Actinomycetota bacterium]